MPVIYEEDRIITCPYCRKNMVPKREETKTQIRKRCTKCKMTITVINKGRIEVL